MPGVSLKRGNGCDDNNAVQAVAVAVMSSCCMLLSHVTCTSLYIHVDKLQLYSVFSK